MKKFHVRPPHFRIRQELRTQITMAISTSPRHSFDTENDILALIDEGILDYSSAEDSIETDTAMDVQDSLDESMHAFSLSVPVAPMSPQSSVADAAEKTTKYLEKLYCMLEQCPPSVAAWTNDGTAFAIYNSSALEKTMIPKFFKPIKFESFARQLNSYGFKKTKLVMRDTVVFEFRHARFVRGQSDQLRTIQRRRRRMQRLSSTDMADMSDMELRCMVGDMMRFVQTLQSELIETKEMVKSLVDAKTNDMADF
ncbi:hypothetical protein LEN26_017609 [Aphanomyces euteiches]|nr:hypothetical protein LEN26_017609 [Aphanomyces euteiches]KAH9106008.1 hypothetical protein AeMF1_018303 [Aphanomyces euteiches]KAH9196962.1 hypothetical protein AeNC1_001041 [Aphanomyces euteiches]